MPMKIRISADSTCDLTSELIEQYDVKIAPLYILMDDRALRDGIECTREDIFAYTSRTGKLCGTAAVSIADYLDFFGEELKTYDQIVHFTISSDMSACFQNACDAAEEFPGRVFVVDSRNLSTGIGLLVLEAAELLCQAGIEARVVKLNAIAPLRNEEVLAALGHEKRLLVLEDCMATGCVGQRIAAILAQERVEPRCLTLKNLGGRFAPQGTVDQLYRAFGLDARSVADSVEEMLHEQ